MVCKYDEIQGISNELMPSTFVQNTINDNGGKKIDYCLTNMFFMIIMTLNLWETMDPFRHLMCKAKISKLIFDCDK